MFLPFIIFLSSLFLTAARNEVGNKSTNILLSAQTTVFFSKESFIYIFWLQDRRLDEMENLLRQQQELILELQVETANQRLYIEQQDKRIAQLEVEVNPSPSRFVM